MPSLVEVFGGRIRLKVSAPQDSGGSPVLSYSIYERRDAPIHVHQVSEFEFDIVGLSQLTLYFFVTCARNDVGEGPPSAELPVMTTVANAPGAVAEITFVNATFEYITVAWSYPEDTGGDFDYLSFNLKYVNLTDGQVFELEDVSSPFIVYDLAAATNYLIQVQAKNDYGLGDWNNGATFLTEQISAGMMEFEQGQEEVKEDALSIALLVKRTKGTVVPAACNYSTLDGTALQAVHYVGQTGTLMFPSGVAQSTINITILNNNVIDDPDKFFRVELSPYSDQSGEIGLNDIVTVVIRDDGDSGIIQFARPSFSVLESSPSVLIPLQRLMAFSGASTVTVAPIDVLGGAKYQQDYSIANPTVVFSDQQRDASLVVQILNDAVYQTNKVFGLSMTIASGRASLGSISNAFIQIVDDGDISAPWPVTAVNFSGITGGMFTASWPPPENFGGASIPFLSYHVIVESWFDRKQFTALTESIRIAGLRESTEYSVTVISRNSYYESAQSSVFQVQTTPTTPPSIPLNVDVIWKTGGSANVTWSEPIDNGGSSITMYRLYIRTSTDNSISSVSTIDTSYAFYGLQHLTDYTVAVQAKNSEKIFGEISPDVTFTTRAPTLPGKPLGVASIVATGGAFQMQLIPPLDTGGLPIITFKLYINSPELPTVFNIAAQESASEISVYGLTYMTHYKMKYQVATLAGVSEFSDYIDAQTTFLTLPSEPQSFAYSAITGGSVTFSWLPPVDNGGSPIDRYALFYLSSFSTEEQSVVIMTKPIGTNAIVYQLTDLLANVWYRFHVIAVNDVTACASQELFKSYKTISLVMPNVTLPDPPRDIQVIKNTAGVQVIAWSPPTDKGGDNSIIYELYSEANEVIYRGDMTTFQRSSLKLDTMYKYSVAAINSFGSSVRSAVVGVKTLGYITIPGAPTNLIQKFSGGGEVGLSWSPPDETGGDDIIGYKLQRNGVILDTSGLIPTANYMDDFDLQANTEYIYAVQASNRFGFGPWSGSLVAATGSPSWPKMPVNLQVTQDIHGGFQVTWDPPNDIGGLSLTGFHFVLLQQQSEGDPFSVMVDDTTLVENLYDYFGVNVNTNYQVRVTCVNPMGESLVFAQQVFKTKGPFLSMAPPKPSLLDVRAQSVALGLSLPVYTGGAAVTKFSLYQNGIKVKEVPGDVDSVVADGLAPDTSYDFTVAVVTVAALGESQPSEALRVWTSDPEPPSYVYGVDVLAITSSTITLTWLGPDTTGGIDVFFNVEVLDSHSGETSSFQFFQPPAVTIDGLAPVTMYSLRVSAQNAAGLGGWSDWVDQETDTERRGVVTVVPAKTTILENQGTLLLKLERSGGVSGPILCHYVLDQEDTDAVEGRDFALDVEANRQFVFQDGETEKTISIQIIDNSVFDPVPRDIYLVLYDDTARTNEVIDPFSFSIEISDDGDAGMIGFAASLLSVAENANILTLTLKRQLGLSSESIVKIGVPDRFARTAQPEIDFRVPPDPITFADGQQSATTRIIIQNNDVFDFPLKFFLLNLTVVKGGSTVGPISFVNITIQDDGDQSVPGTITDPVVAKATGGMLQLAWKEPLNTGGTSLGVTRYNVNMTFAGIMRSYSTSDNTPTIAIGMLNVLTQYTFTIAAQNTIGQGKTQQLIGKTTTFTKPGAPQNLEVTGATGGTISFKVIPPIDNGGKLLDGYKALLRVHDPLDNVNWEVAYDRPDDNATSITVAVRYAVTTYDIIIQAYNNLGAGDESSVFMVSSSQLSPPGPPRFQMERAFSTGGSISLSWDPPFDQGGFSSITYRFFQRKASLTQRFQQSTAVVNDSKGTLYVLDAETSYEIVACAISPDMDAQSRHDSVTGVLDLAEGGLLTSVDLRNMLKPGDFFLFANYMFQVDPIRGLTDKMIYYEKGQYPDGSVDATMDLDDATQDLVYYLGKMSGVITFKTNLPTAPPYPPDPVLVKATGGALFLRLFSPLDTGGIPVNDFDLYVDGNKVEGVLFDYKRINPLQLELTAEIGGLSPNTQYLFVYLAVNDISACSVVIPPLDQPYAFQTSSPSKPEVVSNFRQQSSTGGGIYMVWNPPLDRGSDVQLRYQLYMSSMLATPSWQLVYNDTATSFRKAGLLSSTFYLFRISCRNEIGSSDNSTDYQFNTSVDSTPGPPGTVRMVNATGGMIYLTWDPPEDDGGRRITHYVLKGNDMEKTSESTITFFGGLVADTSYEFTVFAANSLGVGTEGSTTTLNTTSITSPSTPSEVDVLYSSGGAVVLAIAVPDDTGGVTTEQLTFDVVVSGISVTSDTLNRVASISEVYPDLTSGISSRRLSEGADDATQIHRRLQDVIVPENSILYQIGNLSPQTAYPFTLNAVNSVGASDATPDFVGATSTSTPPAAPNAPELYQASGGSLSIQWKPPVDSGGSPVTSYYLNLTFLAVEIDHCAGLIVECTISGLYSSTEYQVTLYAFNDVGASPPSPTVSFTTEGTGVPKGPVNPRVLAASTSSVTLAWEKCADERGSFVYMFEIDIFTLDSAIPAAVAQVISDEVIVQDITPTTYSSTVDGLIPATSYYATIFAITVSLDNGDPSQRVPFSTTLFTGQPQVPTIGCASATSTSVLWPESDGAVLYHLYRDENELIYEGTDTFFDDTSVQVGRIYTYQTEVVFADNVISPKSEKASHTVEAVQTSVCFGFRGIIRLKNYQNSFSKSWKIVPGASYGVKFTISFFDLECDHDTLEIITGTSGVSKTLMKDGCYREGTFIISTSTNVDTVELVFRSDESVHRRGFDLTYELDDTLKEEVRVPCPGDVVCSGRGSCIGGKCLCFYGYTGEDCSNDVICPTAEEMDVCKTVECHPVCYLDPKNVVAVAENGDDVQGTGEIMDTSYHGTASKAVRSLRRAAEITKPGGLILLYEGTLRGEDNCNIAFSIAEFTLMGIVGQSMSYLDCANSSSGLTIQGSKALITGLTVQNVAGETGAAFRIVNSEVTLDNVVVSQAASTLKGGCIHATGSVLTIRYSTLSQCSSVNGSAVFLHASGLTLESSQIAECHATNGGALFVEAGSNVTGVDAMIANNTADVYGGGMFVIGDAVVENLEITNNVAAFGGAVAIEHSSSTISECRIHQNTALQDGGGIALLVDANMALQSSSIFLNDAKRYGGGITMISNGTLTASEDSLIERCSAVIGGGLYGQFSTAKLSGLNISSCSVSTFGGGAAFLNSSVVLDSLVIQANQAEGGGGLYLYSQCHVMAQNCSLVNNDAINGGGIFMESSALVGSGSNLMRKNAAKSGGGVFVDGDGTLETLLIEDCEALNGGALYVHQADSIVLNAIMLSNNTAIGSGGGAFVNSSSLTASQVIVSENSAASGGGVHSSDSRLAGDLTIHHNSASSGGGISVSGSTVLQGIVVTKNSADVGGGGLFLQHTGQLLMENVNVTHCVAMAGFGGGVYAATQSRIIHHGLLVANCSAQQGGGIFLNGSSISSETTSVAQLVGNEALHEGGHVFLGGSPVLAANISASFGSAMYGGVVASTNATECSVAYVMATNSTASMLGGGAYFGPNSSCNVNNVQVYGNQALGSGGGMAVRDGDVWHQNLTVTQNWANEGGGIYMASSTDGIARLIGSGTSPTKSVIAANAVPSSGRGGNMVLASNGLCEVNDIVVSNGQVANGRGGGIYVLGNGNVSAANLIVKDNKGDEGGGIFVEDSNQFTLVDSNVRNNSARKGGGIVAYGENVQPALTIERCVVSMNHADQEGGGVKVDNGIFHATDVVFIWNGVSSKSGTAGGLLTTGNSPAHVERSLFLNNEAMQGGAFGGSLAAVASISNSVLTWSSSGVPEPWRTLYESVSDLPYVSDTGSRTMTPSRGGFILLQDESTTLTMSTCSISMGVAETGGGAYVVKGATLRLDSTSRCTQSLASEAGGCLYLSNYATAIVKDSSVDTNAANNLGGGVYVQDSSTLLFNTSTLYNNSADDSGGGMYLNTGSEVQAIMQDSIVSSNIAKGQGSGVFVGRDATLFSSGTIFLLNGGDTSTGRNEAGGGLCASDANIEIENCTFSGNTARSGGAVYIDRSSTVLLSNSTMTANTAQDEGGAIHMTLGGNLTISDNTRFERNSATSGGALAATEASALLVFNTSFVGNQASGEGGAVMVDDDVAAHLESCHFEMNTAHSGGGFAANSKSSLVITGSTFYVNTVSFRGGAMVLDSLVNTSISRVNCTHNSAPSGGCVFWYAFDDEMDPVLPCNNCTVESNSRYDYATNTRNVEVAWWPAVATSGVFALQYPSEISFEPLPDVNESFSELHDVWPRLKAVDLYDQIEILDNDTQCVIAGTNDSNKYVVFTPRDMVTASRGILVFEEATFVAESRDQEYPLDVVCYLPDRSQVRFSLATRMGSCLPGFKIENGKCVRCMKDRYSLDGVNCYDCPPGALCNASIRAVIEKQATVFGTTSPRTQQGYYLFTAPQSRHNRDCDPSQWKASDPCLPTALRYPNASLAAVVHSCALTMSKTFGEGWPSDRVFSCLSNQTLYKCDVDSACNASVTVEERQAQMMSVNATCGSGYDEVVCSVCATGYQKTQDGSCKECHQASEEARQSVQWQNFVYPVLIVIGIIAAIYSVRFYLRDSTEVFLLQKAQADRRMKAFSEKDRQMLERIQKQKHALQEYLKSKLVRAVQKIGGKFVKPKQKRVLFGVEVDVQQRKFPIKPSKLKIFVGFFQIFGNFKDTFVIKWSVQVQSIMSFSAKFNLDLVAIAGVDCVVTRTFYFDFTVTISLVVLALTVITGYFYRGMRRYSAKLQLIPRNCIRCGLPVLEMERVRNDDESLNPFVIIRTWCRYIQTKRQARPFSANVMDTSKDEARAADAKRLKSDLGMSQVKTPYLGVFRSVHKLCPTAHRISGMLLDRTIRANLRVWQARVKLRMNYLTYRNKCVKLYCWIALFLYPMVSKTILTVYNCQEVGSGWYLVNDRRIICYDAKWLIFGTVSTIGVFVWVIGIPFLFWILILLAQDRGVRKRLRLLQKPQMAKMRQKWVTEMIVYHESQGTHIKDMDDPFVQDEYLELYMKAKNLNDSTVESRLGFIYADYRNEYWWFEVVDLSRKLFMSGVIVFVQQGSVEQVLLAIVVCLVTMWFLLYFQPYDEYTDNLIASVTQLQLFLTLWLGLMTQLNDMNDESQFNERALSYVLVLTCITVTGFGVVMIFKEGLAESRRAYLEEKAKREQMVQQRVKKLWRKALNFVCYQQQEENPGGITFRGMSVRVMMEAIRRLKQERKRVKKQEPIAIEEVVLEKVDNSTY